VTDPLPDLGYKADRARSPQSDELSMYLPVDPVKTV
jgi:hypothetical protein